MSNSGWVKIYRKIQDKGYYRNSSYIHLWLHLLIKANHEGKEFLWNNKIIKIRRGQILTGRSKLVFETGIERNKVERILKCFEIEQQIEQQTFSKFRLITVKKYEEYQNNEQENEPKVSSKRAASEQQVSTNKNEKNYKNEKNRELGADTASPSPAQLTRELFASPEKQQSLAQMIFEKKNVPLPLAEQEVKNFVDYWTERTKSGLKQRWELQPTFEVNKRLATWFSKLHSLAPKNKGIQSL